MADPLKRDAQNQSRAAAGMKFGQRLRARGVDSNMAGRFEPLSFSAEWDGWDIEFEDELVKTEVRLETPRSAITRNTSPDIPFDRSVNPYRGCEHGCVYCYARPTHGYLNLSAGIDFETKLIARPNIAAVLDKELRAKSYRVAPLALGTNTDPWQPIERDHRATRQILEVLSAFNHPLTITTRSTLIERDIDLLAPMASRGLVEVGISITTLNADLARKLEPRAPSPARRLRMIENLSAAGIPTRLMLAPVIPGLTDPEIEAIMEAAAKAGARAAHWLLLRLPHEVAPLFEEWLTTHMPLHKAKVMARLHDLHGGQSYDASFGKRFHGQGVWSKLIAARFRIALERYNLAPALPPLDCKQFAPPLAQGAQLSLF